MGLTKEDIEAIENWLSPISSYDCLSYNYKFSRSCRAHGHSLGRIKCDTACIKLFPEITGRGNCPCNLYGEKHVRETAEKAIEAAKLRRIKWKK